MLWLKKICKYYKQKFTFRNKILKVQLHQTIASNLKLLFDVTEPLSYIKQ